jgi:hypothetical protein
MARVPSRAPSQNAYRGSVGTTRTQAVHFTAASGDVLAATVHIGVDAVADPELAERLKDPDPARALNSVACPDGSHSVVQVPVVYHDPAAEVMVLVLGESDRHRELAERARLYTELAADMVAVPEYVREFGVVFGAAGLSAYLEGRAEKALAEARSGDLAREIERERAHVEREKAQLERRRIELAARDVELERARDELDRRTADLERRTAEIDIVQHDLARKLAEVDRLPADAGQRRDAAPGGATRVDRSPRASDDQTNPFAMDGAGLEGPDPGLADQLEPEGEATAASAFAPTAGGALPAGSDPVTTEVGDLPSGADPWVDAFAAGAQPWALAVDGGAVRIALRMGPAHLPMRRGPLDLRLQLHRTPTYPLVGLAIGAPGAVRGAGGALIPVLLDVAAEPDRAALAALERSFAVTVDLVADGRPVRRARLVAPLAANVAYVVHAAGDHLHSIGHDGTEASASRARKLASDPDFDLLGLAHPEAGEFRPDKLGQLDTPAHVRRALAVCRRFAKPSREDYLVCVRGYPLDRWRAERRAVLERAVELGLWMGTDLAQAAVSEGLARSRKDLVARLAAAFEVTAAAAGDLDPDAVEDNRKAIAEEARSLGVPVGAGAPEPGRPRASEDEPQVSGTIEPRPQPIDPRGRSVDELLALLDDRTSRVAAALELCDRAEPRAIRPVLAAVRRMGRSEAVRVLGAAVKFGEAAAPALTAGLASSKAFLRHGCALALALLRTEAGTDAVIDLLLSEPTEIWREVARAVGQVGPAALMPLASRFGRLGDSATPAAHERIAWAMAHVGVRGGRQAVETLAAGQSVVAPVARAALDFMAPAARDDLRVRQGAAAGSSPGREVTVNRAFSRRFFQALERGLPELGASELEALDASGPMEMLDEADLIDLGDDDDDEPEAELDESDLIPT